MLAPAGLREWLPSFQRAEKLLLIFLAAWAAARLTSTSTALQFVLAFAAAGVLVYVLVRYATKLLRRLVWRLRNRLLVAFLFVAVIPLALIATLVAAGAQSVAGQVAVYLVYSELDRRLASLRDSAAALTEVDESQIQTAMNRFSGFQRRLFPDLTLAAATAGRTWTVPFSANPLSLADQDGNGLIVKGDRLYAWAQASNGARRVALWAPLTEQFFSDLQPNLGEISVLPETSRAFSLAAPSGAVLERSGVGPPVNRFDLELLWGTRLPVRFWDDPSRSENALLGVHSRISSVAAVIFSQETDSSALVLYGLAVSFLIVEALSIVIGVSITRSITGAVHDLYEGTQRVMEGDFSHRIPVQGGEQVAELSRSFNRMTENVERLLVVSKENERIKAEIEIAREVQRQLFPTRLPQLPGLEIRAVCRAASSVSGDYYDYQALPGSRLVVAVGDVAGKGISAALLMASLQSTLRVQLREWREGVSTQRLMTGINEQLYLNTTPEKYATLFLAVYEDTTGLLRYTNAGHLPPFLIRAGAATALDVNGMIVGAFPQAQYTESQISMLAGDILLCYTDGATEPENEFGEMFGDQRLAEVVIKNGHLGVDEILESVSEAVRDFTGSPELQDDMTLLVARKL